MPTYIKHRVVNGWVGRKQPIVQGSEGRLSSATGDAEVCRVWQYIVTVWVVTVRLTPVRAIGDAGDFFGDAER